MTKTVDDVRSFWEAHPLGTGEIAHGAGSLEYFEEHRRLVIDDCLAGEFDERVTPPPANRERVLDLGCGPGFWTIELAQRGCRNITAADLTEAGLNLARKRCGIYNVKAEFSRQNAEAMTFPSGMFTHVNCQGVIHHTPDTEACVREIARVLAKGGTASISVYYKNVFLRLWPLLRPIGKAVHRIGGGLKGRGRESIFALDDINEIVRHYDGSENPVGKAYSKSGFLKMLEPYFIVKETYLHLFPARAFPFKLPGAVHRFLDRRTGFLIYATLEKR